MTVITWLLDLKWYIMFVFIVTILLLFSTTTVSTNSNITSKTIPYTNVHIDAPLQYTNLSALFNQYIGRHPNAYKDTNLRESQYNTFKYNIDRLNVLNERLWNRSKEDHKEYFPLKDLDTMHQWIDGLIEDNLNTFYLYNLSELPPQPMQITNDEELFIKYIDYYSKVYENETDWQTHYAAFKYNLGSLNKYNQMNWEHAKRDKTKYCPVYPEDAVVQDWIGLTENEIVEVNKTCIEVCNGDLYCFKLCDVGAEQIFNTDL